MEGWIDENHNGVRYGLAGEVLVEENTPYQKITIIKSKRYGNGLLLDGSWMTAELQDRHYHEALVHPALCGAKGIKRVLVIGGGDGGTARECLRYKDVQQLDLVEIDLRVVELCKQYLPKVGGNAWNDPRLKLKFEDGVDWVQTIEDETYDVVLVDGSDPSTPAKELFKRTFFEHCLRVLRPGGVFATQSESPEAFRKVHISMVRLIRDVFTYADPLYGCVPMYPSGWWSWTFAAIDSPRYRQPDPERSLAIAAGCDIWSPRWQRGGFDAIPNFIAREL
tara:strand:+ start:243 stop:1079 length:837 start_codon:yes stop_codon:yes gene_type:complete